MIRAAGVGGFFTGLLGQAEVRESGEEGLTQERQEERGLYTFSGRYLLHSVSLHNRRWLYVRKGKGKKQNYKKEYLKARRRGSGVGLSSRMLSTSKVREREDKRAGGTKKDSIFLLFLSGKIVKWTS